MNDLVFENSVGDKALVQLGPVIAEGVAGRIHSVLNAKGVVAKLYKEKGDLPVYSKKIRAMMGSPPNLPAFEFHGRTYVQIAWPLGPLSQNDEFAGFLMPEVDTAAATELENILQKKQRQRKGLPEFYGGRVLLATNLAALMAELHSLGHYMIDMKPANVRFYPHSWYLAILDTDGFSIGGTKRLPADHFTDEYIAPEADGKAPSDLGVQQDLFALATIIFRLLNNGIHPFQGVDVASGLPTTIQPRIFSGLYSYGLKTCAKAKASRSSIHEYFEHDTRLLFDRAFTTVDRRPSAEEWRSHLAGLIKGRGLVQCAKHPDLHAHFSKGCGHCAVESQFANLRTASVPPVKPKAPSAGSNSPWGRPGLVLSTTAPAPPAAVASPPVQARGMSSSTWFYLGLALFAAVVVLSKRPPPPVATSPAPEIAAPAPTSIPSPSPYSAPDVEAAREQEKLALLQAERERQEHAERLRNRISFEVTNKYSRKVWLTFYSGDHTKAWPGDGSYYFLGKGENQSFDLTCEYGEQICYGAWSEGGALSTSWGSGYKGKSGCSSCCTQCGSGTSAVVLNGSNSYTPKPSITFRVRSSHYSPLLVAFYARSGRSGWPGGDGPGRVNGYMIGDDAVHDYNLNCRRGEKICFGAWEHRNTEGQYWGCGPGCFRACTDCCYTCDGEETSIINLTGSHGLE